MLQCYNFQIYFSQILTNFLNSIKFLLKRCTKIKETIISKDQIIHLKKYIYIKNQEK